VNAGPGVPARPRQTLSLELSLTRGSLRVVVLSELDLDPHAITRAKGHCQLIDVGNERVITRPLLAVGCSAGQQAANANSAPAPS